MNNTKTHIIIHGFALLHLVVCIICKAAGFPDSLILTLATMAMVVILCIDECLSIEFTAITIVLANILGFMLGNIGAMILGNNYVSTFLTTEILGWGIVLMVKLLKPVRIDKEEFWKENVGWLVAAIVIVFGLRVSIDLIVSHTKFGDSPAMSITAQVAAFCLLLLIFFVLHMRNQMELEREKSRSLEKALKTYMTPSSAYKEKFIVHLNSRIVPIHTKEIAYFYADHKSTFLVTASGANPPLDESLDSLESQLDPAQFFRISRSCIIALTSIGSISKLHGGRLQISPPQGLPAFTDLTVSRSRVPSFLEWFEG